MCRRTKKACTLLGADPASWLKYEILPGHAALGASFEKLEAAIRNTADGHIRAARATLAEIDDAGIREWYVEHAQVAGTRQMAILDSRIPFERPDKLDRPYPSPAVEAELLRRGSFRCRYCLRRVLSRHVLKAFHENSDGTFSRGRPQTIDREDKFALQAKDDGFGDGKGFIVHAHPAGSEELRFSADEIIAPNRLTLDSDIIDAATGSMRYYQHNSMINSAAIHCGGSPGREWP